MRIEESENVTREYLDGLDSSQYLMYAHLIKAFGEHMELKTLQTVIKTPPTQEDCEKLTSLVSFVMGKELGGSDIMRTEAENSDDIIDIYLELKESYSILKKEHGLNKKTVNKIFGKIKKNIFLLRLPNYYYSLPFILQDIILYHRGVNNIHDMRQNFSVINLMGGRVILPTKVFDDIIEKMNSVIGALKGEVEG